MRRRGFRSRHTAAIAALVFLLLGAAQLRAADRPASPRDWILLAADRLCAPDRPVTGHEAEKALPRSWLLEDTALRRARDVVGRKQVFALPGGDELRLMRSEVHGRLRRLTFEYYAADQEGLHPALQAMSDAGCTLRSGRAITTEDDGWRLLQQLDGDLETLRWNETLEAPWPGGSDPRGVRVALVDSGLAYDLDLFRDTLARDAKGSPLGYDFWDMDPLPYDGDTSLGPFLPIRHGTAVASVLVREAPQAALLPFRYPRPDMSRMADLVRQAAEAGARILAMPLGSHNREDWTSFERAMAAHPDLLAIVSAGNDGIDLDREPLYPASLPIDNMIVVTSSDGFGKLARGSNWGAATVDLMLAAENQPVVDFRGARGTASGSSYAVPRLAALAVRLLDKSPSLTAQELKAKIFARAVPSPYEATKVVAVGWLANPAE